MTTDDTLDGQAVRGVRDRSLVAAYEPHDLAQDHLEAKLQSHGFTVEQHGTDDRHADEIKLGHGPDILVKRDGVGVCYIEIKSKTDPTWIGRCNYRHYREYSSFAAEVNLPVFIWFALVDEDQETVDRTAFIEIEGDNDQISGDVLDITDEELVFHERHTEQLDDGYYTVEGDDCLNVRSDQQIVDEIPNVFGNRVVCLNEDQFRSWEWFLRRIDVDTDGQKPLDELFDAVEDLLAEQVFENPKYDIYQFRTQKGRAGPSLDGHTEINLRKGDDDVEVVVDGATIGTVSP